MDSLNVPQSESRSDKVRGTLHEMDLLELDNGVRNRRPLSLWNE